MGKVEKFEDLNVWIKSRALTNSIYRIILSDCDIKDYPLKDQLNRSSGSVMDNIAEGFERLGNKEFRQFLTVAKASCSEVKSQLYRCFDREYIAKDQFNELYKEVDTVSKMIHGLIHYLNTTEYKGSKFKEPEFEYNNLKTQT